MTTRTVGVTHTTVTTPGTNGGSAPSIRTIIRGGILAGTPKAEIQAKVTELYPTSAAALKFAKHYAWYKATMKKAGELPEQQPQA